MRSSQLAGWALVLMGLTACGLSHPTHPPFSSDVLSETSDIAPDAGPCGAEGEACCAQTVDGGAVGSGCQAGLVCDANRCARCPAGLSACDNQCIDTSASSEHCGACGNRCPAGTACVRGDGGAPRCDLACAMGETVCGAACVATASDRSHCGACNNDCARRFPNADTACANGACRLAGCSAPFADCDGVEDNGCETNTQTRTDHCGSCGMTCNLPNASATCAGGRCAIATCAAGFADCNSNPSDGCETDTRATLAHCGRCGMVCQPQAGRSVACVAGACQQSEMCVSPTMGDCDGAPGCETNLATSVSHCGGCGQPCSRNGGVPSCGGSPPRCSITCSAGFGDCDGNITTGCETNTNVSVSHCGGCGRACNLPNAAMSCVGGSCRVVSCNAGFADCDRNPANGCEQALSTDPNHCGMCGNRCPAEQVCRGGTCTCPMAGQTYCAALARCFDLRADASHCGMCTTVCTGGQTCQSGTCRCPTGQTLCNGRCVNPQSDTSHCGGCNRVCMVSNATARCSMGACAVGTCNAGSADCDMNPANGCEINVTSDANNCGRCGGRCPAGQFCSNGACAMCGVAGSPPCPMGGCGALAVCSNVCRNTQTDNAHCGGCGMACAPGQTCCGGMCRNLMSDTNHCGRCGMACGPGQSCCSGTCRSTMTDTNHCGRCGNACPMRANGMTVCANGSCAFTCNGGYGDCDANPTNGCEANFNTSLTHCNGCGRLCMLPNATPQCMSGVCRVMSCNAGFRDCDMNATSGCEADTRTSTSHCGMCGRACTAGQTCANGMCVTPDAGAPDAGPPDAGPPDAGPMMDAGAQPDVPRDAPDVSVMDAPRG